MTVFRFQVVFTTGEAFFGSSSYTRFKYHGPTYRSTRSSNYSLSRNSIHFTIHYPLNRYTVLPIVNGHPPAKIIPTNQYLFIALGPGLENRTLARKMEKEKKALKMISDADNLF